MKHRVLFLSLACSAALAACQSPSTVPSFVANAARSNRAATTQAWGYVYSDPEGKPLANVRVELAAWLPIRGRLEPPREVARTNAAGRFTFTARNGKYLLTIGSDEAYTPPPGYQTPDPLTSVGDDPGLPNMHWLATVHDTLELKGGRQLLRASTLPKQIIGGGSGRPYEYIQVPTIEKTQNYRVSLLSRLEAECLVAEQMRRRKLHLQPLVPDEWLVENTRAMHGAQVALNLVWDGYDWSAIGGPKSAPQSSTAGGSTCASIVLRQPVNGQESNGRTLWFAAADGLSRQDPKTHERDTLQIEEWFIDPRISPQIWPSPVTGPKGDAR